MPPTDRLEMLVNLDEAGARSQIAALERRPLRVPLEFQGGRAGGRMPGGVRGVGGLGRIPGMGRGAGIGRMIAGGYGGTGIALGAGMLAAQMIREGMQPGKSWGQIIASGAGAAMGGIGFKMLMAPDPTLMTQAIGAGLIILGSMLPDLWKWYEKRKKGADAGGMDLRGLLERFKKDLPFRLPPPPTGDDVVEEFRTFGGGFGATEPRAPARDVIAEMHAALMHHDLIREFRAIRGLLGQLVLQGSV